MSTSPYPLGAFELVRPVQQGGMGAIWKGLHPASGLPVAVKFIRPERAADPELLWAFQQEVRAVAALSHPGVVRIFEVGLTSTSTAEVPVDSPYLVMDWAAGGSLLAQLPLADWGAVKGLATALLEALAHVHARGLVHRDIKPANVLCLRRSLSRICLSDFGIARFRHEGAQDKVLGTPRYMAPEQIDPGLGPQGPWTDLYALGCLLWELISGQTPFVGAPRAVLSAHLAGRLPPLRPAFEVPGGAGDWLRQLLAPAPADRVAFAADALAALRALPAAGSGRGRLPPAPGVGAPTETLQPAETVTGADFDRPLPVAAPVSAARTQPAPFDPEGWRRADGGVAELTRRQKLIRDVGLGLVGLRQPPVVGRQEEQRALWRVLEQVHETGHPRVVMLTAPSGLGCSRLGRWLGEQAHARGAAHVIQAHDLQGLRRALAAALRCSEHPLSLQAALRLRGLEGPLPLLEAAAGPARDAALRLLLQALGRDRAVVVFFDDVLAGSEIWTFCQRLLVAAERHPAPALIALTTPLPLPEPAEQLASSGAAVIAVPPLRAAAGHQLIEAMLQLNPALREQLVARVGGSPRALLEMLRALAGQGRLRPGGVGFELEGELDAILLESARLPGGWSKEERSAMAAAAAAAVRGAVSLTLWRAVCWRIGVAWPQALLRPLADAGRVQLSTEGLLFVAPELPLALEAHARACGEWGALHAACAEALRGADEPLRLGVHLRAAGDREGAVDALLAAAADPRTDHAAALALTEELARLMAALPDGDPRHGARLNLAMTAAASLSMPERVLQLAGEALPQARANGWLRTECFALCHSGDILRVRGEDGVDALISQALEVAERSGEAICRALALRLRGLRLAEQRVDLVAAVRQLEAALAAAEQTGRLRLVLGLRLMLATAQGMRQERAKARALHQESVRMARAHGLIDLEADGQFDLGNLAMYDGDYPQARGCFEEAIRLYWLCGRRHPVSMVSAQLGDLLVRMGELEAAWAPLERALNEPLIRARPIYMAQMHMNWLHLAAKSGDSALLEEHLRAIQALVDHCGPETLSYAERLPALVQDPRLREQTRALALAMRESWARRSTK